MLIDKRSIGLFGLHIYSCTQTPMNTKSNGILFCYYCSAIKYCYLLLLLLLLHLSNLRTKNHTVRLLVKQKSGEKKREYFVSVRFPPPFAFFIDGDISTGTMSDNIYARLMFSVDVVAYSPPAQQQAVGFIDDGPGYTVPYAQRCRGICRTFRLTIENISLGLLWTNRTASDIAGIKIKKSTSGCLSERIHSGYHCSDSHEEHNALIVGMLHSVFPFLYSV